MSGLSFHERPAALEPAAGLLILHHGRGTDERDMVGLGEALDPERRVHLVTPRAPLRLPGSPGYHWYRVPRVGYPDPPSFHAAMKALGALHDELFERTGIPPQRTVLGGFSMGAVMSYALGLFAARPRPAGIMAFSGFIPTVEGWQVDRKRLPGLPILIAHGSSDPVIDVRFARQAALLLREGAAEVSYLESPLAHNIDAADIAPARMWLASDLQAAAQAGSPGVA